MKHLKIYEGYNTPDVGDYVICDIHIGQFNEFKDLKDFVVDHIGVIVSLPKNSDEYNYIVSYINLPTNLDSYVHGARYEPGINFSIDEIKHWSKDRDKLETILSTNKFNI